MTASGEVPLSDERVNILLVDDRVENLVALEAVLDDLGQNLVRASSGRDALKHLLDEDFAVILLDVQMPGMDGFETAMMIRSRERSRHTPIVFLTAINKNETHVSRGYSVGAVDYVFKPFQPEVLKAKVAAFVELAKKTRELQVEIVQRQQTEELLDASNALLETISRALVEFIEEPDPAGTFEKLLASILTLTDSEFGFIGEILYVPGDAPFLKTHAARDNRGRSLEALYNGRAGALLEPYDLHSLYDEAQCRGCPIIANDISEQWGREKLPAGSPMPQSFLGLPFYKGGSLMGVVGVANRPGGYDEDLASHLDPFLNTCAIIVDAYRNDQRRRNAEEEVRRLNDDLERRVVERTAQLKAANRDLEREIAERKRMEEERSRLLTRERAARAEAEDAQQRLAFLGEASAILAGTLDYVGALKRVGQLAVQSVADFCIIDLIGEDGQIQTVAAAHADNTKQEFLRALQHQPASHGGLAKLYAEVLRTGESELMGKGMDAVLSQTSDDDHRVLMERLGVESHVAVPLVARGNTVGVISLGSAGSGRQYGMEDLVLAEDLARRAAVAIDNAMLFEEIKEAGRRKDEYLAILAHELRNPLAAMSNADYVLDELGQEDERITRLRAIISRQTRNLARLVDDLLDISRITRGKIDLKLEPVELATVVQRAVETTGSAIEAHGHRLTVSLPANPIWMEADPTRLEQVLSNLLSNAAKYTEQGGEIWLGATQDGEEVVIRVRDTGIGISPELLPRVFDLFAQADRSLDRSQGGLGIGLALVQNLVRMHQGTVEAHSAGHGKGSEFVVRLPALPAGYSQAAPAAEDAHLTEERSVRVLIVEDNRDAAETLAEILEFWGHEVNMVHSGTEAIERVEEFKPEVVLLDIGLPGMDGYEVARRIRQQEPDGKLLLVALTGYGQDEARRRSQEAGFDLHLTKPVDPAELRRLLASLPVHHPNGIRSEVSMPVEESLTLESRKHRKTGGKATRATV